MQNQQKKENMENGNHNRLATQVHNDNQYNNNEHKSTIKYE